MFYGGERALVNQTARPGLGSVRTGRVALGTWALGGGADWGDTPPQDAAEALAAALEAGLNWIDTSPIYGAAEERIGQVVKGRRSQVLLATKCGICVRGGRPDHDLRPESIAAECEASLRRLQTDYIDLYQIHWPDPKVPLEEALGTLMRLKEQGKIRAAGVCNVSPELLRRACQAGEVAAVQNPLSLLTDGQAAVRQLCREKQMAFVAYGALGGGILSGKYTQPPNFRRRDARRYFYTYYFADGFAAAAPVAARVREVAAQKKVPAVAVALAWVLAQDGVSRVLAGARSAQQVRELALAQQVELTGQEQEFLHG